MRIFKAILIISLLMIVYYPLLVQAFVDTPHWFFLIGIPLFAVYCLHYEAGTNTIVFLEGALAVNAVRGGMLKTKKQRITHLPYKDIVEITDYGDKLMLKMAQQIVVNKGGFLSKPVITDTFLLFPADKNGLVAALRDKGVKKITIG